MGDVQGVEDSKGSIPWLVSADRGVLRFSSSIALRLGAGASESDSDVESYVGGLSQDLGVSGSVSGIIESCLVG